MPNLVMSLRMDSKSASQRLGRDWTGWNWSDKAHYICSHLTIYRPLTAATPDLAHINPASIYFDVRYQTSRHSLNAALSPTVTLHNESYLQPLGGWLCGRRLSSGPMCLDCGQYPKLCCGYSQTSEQPSSFTLMIFRAHASTKPLLALVALTRRTSHASAKTLQPSTVLPSIAC